jgi:hypothetical protein
LIVSFIHGDTMSVADEVIAGGKPRRARSDDGYVHGVLQFNQLLLTQSRNGTERQKRNMNFSASLHLPGSAFIKACRAKFLILQRSR